MAKPTPTRRRFLASTAGTAVTLGVAGCVSGGNSQSGDTTDDDHSESEDGEHEQEGHDDESEDGEHEQEGHDDESEHEDEEHEEESDDHGHDHDEGMPEEPSASATVALRTEGSEQHFAPHVVWVEEGGTVTWELESGNHDAVAYHPDNDDKPRRIPEDADPWSTGLLNEAGATATHTFETEGVYDYYCTPHESLGMVGTVIVGQPDPHDQPALEDPQESLPDGASTQLADLGKQVNQALGHTH